MNNEIANREFLFVLKKHTKQPIIFKILNQPQENRSPDISSSLKYREIILLLSIKDAENKYKNQGVILDEELDILIIPTKIEFSSYKNYKYKTENLEISNYLKEIKNFNELDSDIFIKALSKEISDFYKIGQTLCSTIIKVIEKTFIFSGIKVFDLNSADIKKMRGSILTVDDKINYLDQNTNKFLKNNKVFAGLSFIKNCIEKEIMYGVYVDINYSGTNTDYKRIKEVIFYSSNVVWFDAETISIDINCAIINKIIECVFKLIARTEYVEPIIDFYRELKKQNVFFKSDTLVFIIEALLKCEKKQLIESAISELQKIESRHPIIQIANKALRRMQVLNQISETFNINISDLQKLNGVEFEMFLENQFIKNGFKVERTKGSGDFGADLIVETTSGTRSCIQAKRYKQKANLKAVQEVVASLAHYQTDFGIVITTSGFFQSAINLAETNNVELWDEDRLIQFLSGDFSFSMLSNS